VEVQTSNDYHENKGIQTDDENELKKETKPSTKNEKTQTCEELSVTKETQSVEPKIEVVETNDSGEVLPNQNETILEIKFSHDVQNWEQVQDHLKDELKLKIKGKPWLANNGTHFKTMRYFLQRP
jgi:hypothetical protein